MRSRKVGEFRQLRQRGVIASAIALVALMLSASGASASTSIGNAGGTIICSQPASTVQVSSTTTSYAVPAGGGSISSWSIQATAWPGPVGLQVWRPTATALTYTLVGASPLVTLATGTLNTFTLATPIQVQAGDLLGLRIEVKAACMQFTQNTTDVLGIASGTNPTTGSTLVFSSGNTEQLNVAAIVDTPVVVTPTPTPLPTPTATPSAPPTATPSAPPTAKPTPPPTSGSGGRNDGSSDEEDTDDFTGTPMHPHIHHRLHKATFTSTRWSGEGATWSGRRDSD